MKCAVFEFEDNSCAIGQTSWIYGEDAKDFNNETWFFSNEIVVKWPREYAKALRKIQRDDDFDVDEGEFERHAARIVKFGGKG